MACNEAGRPPETKGFRKSPVFTKESRIALGLEGSSP